MEKNKTRELYFRERNLLNTELPFDRIRLGRHYDESQSLSVSGRISSTGYVRVKIQDELYQKLRSDYQDGKIQPGHTEKTKKSVFDAYFNEVLPQWCPVSKLSLILMRCDDTRAYLVTNPVNDVDGYKYLWLKNTQGEWKNLNQITEITPQDPLPSPEPQDRQNTMTNQRPRIHSTNAFVQNLHFFQNIILEGVPGTGKTFAIGQIVKEWRASGGQELMGKGEGDFATTFHPSTSYEDFVEGLRPKVKSSRKIKSLDDQLTIWMNDPQVQNNCLLDLEPDSNQDSFSSEFKSKVDLSNARYIQFKSVGETQNRTLVGRQETYQKLKSLLDMYQQNTSQRLNFQFFWRGTHTFENFDALFLFPALHESVHHNALHLFITPESPSEDELWFYHNPPLSEGNWGIKDGFFLKACQKAYHHPHRDFIILIDEINRANVPKVLGDLLTTIERSKRAIWRSTETSSEDSPNSDGAWDLSECQVVSLPYSGRKFFVPENLFIIATMNTTDRSVAPLDAALRRRFAFMRVKPMSGDDLRKEFETFADNQTIQQSIRIWEQFNTHLMSYIGSDGQLGHSYFMVLRDALKRDSSHLEDKVKWVWQYEVLPQLLDLITTANLQRELFGSSNLTFQSLIRTLGFEVFLKGQGLTESLVIEVKQEEASSESEDGSNLGNHEISNSNSDSNSGSEDVDSAH